jgi:Nucleotidyl transferase AbiEii toxin, Type IV TA system
MTDSKTFFIHQKEFNALVRLVAQEESINPVLVEKDYWIMHCLYGMRQCGLTFELKGGTSLSKGYGIIHRFSEDLDIRIEPDEKLQGFKVYCGKNHDDDKHRKSRAQFFDWLANYLQGKIPGLTSVVRETSFDDSKLRNGGIRLLYESQFPALAGVKIGILLEVGFDGTTPNTPRDISSWTFEKAKSVALGFEDNRALKVPCYLPEYTFVEKLQAVSKHYAQFKAGKTEGKVPENFLRHYYDISQLLELPDVHAFIGTPNYESHKKVCFGSMSTDLSSNEALKLADTKERSLFASEFARTRSLYYKGQPDFAAILEKIGTHLKNL